MEGHIPVKRISTIAALTLFAAFATASIAGTARAGTAEIVFGAAEKTIIANYYGGGGNGGGGKGKNKGDKGGRGQGVGSQGLPPGLARKGQLPPGIAKRQLPSGLASQLPPPPKGFERVIVDNDVLLVEIATQVVHDVLTDIVHNK